MSEKEEEEAFLSLLSDLSQPSSIPKPPPLLFLSRSKREEKEGEEKPKERCVVRSLLSPRLREKKRKKVSLERERNRHEERKKERKKERFMYEERKRHEAL
ncbi:hypothetical protein CSUI_009810 [Cystoisospora suis]|uniref:Uncharacterized protein n=1 Tax=Cystoisospora suis TaxID=483139 RepID=A0A2C6KFS1_9APIC|nr:hypothetical protein CSUI_009810 [Cystoisospora suis]